MRDDYQSLRLEMRDNGRLTVWLRERRVGQGANRSIHQELGRVWADVNDDAAVRSVLVAGEGEDFTPSVDAATQDADAGSFSIAMGLLQEATDLVGNILRCRKPIVSAITGRAGGAGLVVALMADISVASKDAILRDGHVGFGLSAGDHAAMVWPLLCGLAKAKYYLLTSSPLTGAEAERINLVSLAVDHDQTLITAQGIADGLAEGPQHAIQWTKRTLNYWPQSAVPIFDASLAFEGLSFFGNDHHEAVRALQERRPPHFD